MNKITLVNSSNQLQEYIAALSNYPKIQELCNAHFGTIELRDMLSRLLSDTRDHTRKGFPTEVADALLQISILNLEQLEEKLGVEGNQDCTTFVSPKWTVPRNF